MLRQIAPRALFHITGDGLFNLIRTQRPVGFRIETFPEPPPVFRILQDMGKITNEEMFRVFNMGIGFVIALPPGAAGIDTARRIANAAGYRAHVLGRVTEDPERTIIVEPYRIRSRAGKFHSY
jgi:phosphoribosylformylglycinamidine cyclo-ligase